MIIESYPSGPFETNTILIGCPQTKKGAIIDAPLDGTPWLVSMAEKHHLKVEMLLLTHSHWDHIAEVALLKKTFNIPVHVHSADSANLQKPGSDGLPLRFPIEGVVPDAFLEDGQVLTLGSLQIRVIYTPGHSPGGVCFYIESEKILISGDTLFCGTIGRLNFPTSRPDAMWDSLKRLATLPPDTKVFPGHGPATTIGRENWLTRAKEKFS